MSLLLSTLETTIVGTALVSIVDSLHGFDKASWIVTAYLVTYTGIPLAVVFPSCLLMNGTSRLSYHLLEAQRYPRMQNHAPMRDNCVHRILHGVRSL